MATTLALWRSVPDAVWPGGEITAPIVFFFFFGFFFGRKKERGEFMLGENRREGGNQRGFWEDLRNMWWVVFRAVDKGGV